MRIYEDLFGPACYSTLLIRDYAYLFYKVGVFAYAGARRHVAGLKRPNNISRIKREHIPVTSVSPEGYSARSFLSFLPMRRNPRSLDLSVIQLSIYPARCIRRDIGSFSQTNFNVFVSYPRALSHPVAPRYFSYPPRR